MGRYVIAAAAAAFLGGIASTRHGFALGALAIACVAAAVLRGRALGLVLPAAIAIGVFEGFARHEPAAAPADRHLSRFYPAVSDVRADGLGTWSAIVRLGDGTSGSFTATGVAPAVGERVVLRARREPFDDARNPGEPSQRELEAERGVDWHLAHARILARSLPDPLDATLWIARARAWASARLHASLPEPDATILAGAMWGERGALPPELRAEFQDTGTVHVLVTAGLHLGVVAALALAALRALRCGRISASIAAIAIVWLYAAFSGGHLPAIRAATMLSFALVAYAAGREALSWNALGAAAIVIVATRPSAIDGVSFALSFSCVAAILAFASPLRERIERCGVAHGVAEILAVSVAAQLGTWPLTAATFLVIAPYAPLANAFVVPVVGVAMLVGFGALAATPLPPLAGALGNIETALLDWIVACVRTIGSLPGANVIATPPPPWTIALYDVALAGAALAIARNAYVRHAVCAVAVASAACLWPPHSGDAGMLRIVAIDVGQADSLLITTPAGHAYLVDAGGRLERGAAGSDSQAEAVGERIVVPFLVRHGIHHLDAVLLSHPHGDHAGGIAPVIRALGAGAFADSGQSYPGHAYHDALDVARERGVPIVYPRGGTVWTTDDGVTFRFYSPTLPLLTNTRNDINNNSLVFRLEYGRTRMLFMGDAGAEAEQRLLAEQADLRADVLKVGHHGSAYGTTDAFVRAVGASFAVISVGRNNLFGHPAPSTIARLTQSGAHVYRTDENGEVSIETDGNHVCVAGFLQQQQPRCLPAPPFVAILERDGK